MTERSGPPEAVTISGLDPAGLSARPGRQSVVGNQLFIRQSLADHSGNNPGHLLHRIRLSHIVPTHKLIDIPVKMLGRHLVERPLKAPL